MEIFPWDNKPKDNIVINIIPVKQKLNFDLPKPSFSEAPPSTIEASYKNDLNIALIHKAIRAIFSHKMSCINNLIGEKEKIEFELNNKNLSVIEFKIKKEKLANIENEINDIKLGISWKDYVNKSKNLLEKYLDVSSDESKGIINISVYKKEEEDSELIKNRLIIIESYIEIAKNYIKLNIHKEIPNINKCHVCNKDITDLEDEDDKGIFICNCGIEIIPISQNIKYSKFKNDILNKSIYDDLSTFIKRLNAFECKQESNIPEELFDILDKYFIDLGKPSFEKIRNQPLLSNGKKTGTSIKLLESALFATQNSEYYKDMEYLSHKLWGWKIHNLDDYREQIILDYKKTQEIYKNIKREESISGLKIRNSSLNINMRLFWHLKAVDYPYAEYEDFKTVTSRESLEYHNKIMKRMCSEAGIKFIDVI